MKPRTRKQPAGSASEPVANGVVESPVQREARRLLEREAPWRDLPIDDVFRVVPRLWSAAHHLVIDTRGSPPPVAAPELTGEPATDLDRIDDWLFRLDRMGAMGHQHHRIWAWWSAVGTWWVFDEPCPPRAVRRDPRIT